MSNKPTIPNPVCMVVGEVLGDHYFNHAKLNTLFTEAGAPGDPPEGPCVTKCTNWLRRCNEDDHTDAFAVLGRVLEGFMEFNASTAPQWQKGQERAHKILAKNGLSYHTGGKIFGATAGAPTRSLAQMLQDRDLAAVEIEFQRALASVESDPPAGVTAASSLLESLFKIYIEVRGLHLPTKATIKDLWRVTSQDLGLDPRVVQDDDLRRILSGLTSIVDGIGSLRTHAGSAHGRGKDTYQLDGRHARLAIHAAHTLATFIIETWDAKYPRSAQAV